MRTDQVDRRRVRWRATPNESVLDLLRSLTDERLDEADRLHRLGRTRPGGPVLGSVEGFSSARQLANLMRAAKKEAVTDRRRRHDRRAGPPARRPGHGRGSPSFRRRQPRSVRFRSRVPAAFRAARLRQELLSGKKETWKFGYLLDTILTRDTWMHRVDISRATGREFTLSAEHDARIVADAVAEWARRHGQPFTLELSGAAGGVFTQGSGGESISLDAVELCRIFSGRETGGGLLSQEVPF